MGGRVRMRGNRLKGHLYTKLPFPPGPSFISPVSLNCDSDTPYYDLLPIRRDAFLTA